MPFSVLKLASRDRLDWYSLLSACLQFDHCLQELLGCMTGTAGVDNTQRNKQILLPNNDTNLT